MRDVSEWDNIVEEPAGSSNTKEETLPSPPPPPQPRSPTPVVEEETEDKVVGQKTTLVTAHEEPVFNEIFQFDVEKENKFLNICVYGKCEENFSKFLCII